MDSFNSDLIFDLAAGLLPEEEARAAEATLSSADRAELAAQRAVLATIAVTPPVSLTDVERARLHRSVAAATADTTRELSPVAVVAPPARTKTPRAAIWMRWASAAAVAAMFVGVVAVGSQLGSLGGSGNADTSDTLVEQAGADATFAPAAGGTDTAQSTTTFAASPEASEGADGEATDSFAAEAPPEDAAFQILEAPSLRSAQETSDLDEVATWFGGVRDAVRLDPVEDLTAFPCYEIALEDLDITHTFSVTYPGPDGTLQDGIGYAESYSATAELEIFTYDIDTCALVLANTE